MVQMHPFAADKCTSTDWGRLTYGCLPLDSLSTISTGPVTAALGRSRRWLRTAVEGERRVSIGERSMVADWPSFPAERTALEVAKRIGVALPDQNQHGRNKPYRCGQDAHDVRNEYRCQGGEDRVAETEQQADDTKQS